MPNDRGKKRPEDDNSHLQEPPSQAKRARVSKACNECRKKKERCDGVQPQCGPCSSLQRTCCFDTQPKRRGLPTGYVRAVEVLLGLMFQSIDGIEHCITDVLRGEKSLPAWHREQPSSSLVSSLADSWRRSTTMKELERLLADIDHGDETELSTRDLCDRLENAFMNRLLIDENCNTRIELLSPPRTTSPAAFENLAPSTAPEIPVTMLPDLHPTPPVTALQNCNAPMDLPPDWSSEIPVAMLADPQPTPPVAVLQDCNAPTDLPLDWSHLLERYFTDTHTWFPITSKHDMLRQAFCLANKDSEPDYQERLISNGDRAALFASLAYACYRDTLSHEDIPEQLRGSIGFAEAAQHESPSFSLARKMQIEATSILAKGEEGADYDSGHVQALLVLTVLQIDQGLLSQAWITIGKAVYTAILLNIIPNSQRPSQSIVNDKQRRLFLGIYVLETLIAYALTQRPYLQASDLAKVGPLPVDSIEEWEPWRPLDVQQISTGKRIHTPGRSLSTFNTFLDLVTLLNRQAHGLSSLEQTLEGFRSWRTTQPISHRNAIAALDIASAHTPPQMLNITLASLTVDATLQIKSVLAKECSLGPAPFSAIPASAHPCLGAIMRHERLASPSRTCSLMPLFMSILKSQTNIHEIPHTLDQVQQLTAPTDQSTRLTDKEKSLDYFELQTTSRSTLLAHSAVSNARECSGSLLLTPLAANPRYIDASGVLDTQDHIPDGSLFDSLSFLDTADW
jgi:hypothetical protein